MTQFPPPPHHLRATLRPVGPFSRKDSWINKTFLRGIGKHVSKITVFCIAIAKNLEACRFVDLWRRDHICHRSVRHPARGLRRPRWAVAVSRPLRSARRIARKMCRPRLSKCPLSPPQIVPPMWGRLSRQWPACCHALSGFVPAERWPSRVS